MAGNFKMPNKKTTIIVSIIVVILAIIAVTGTVVFLKDRGSTEAADLGNEQVSREETRTSTSAPNEQATVNEETQNNGEQAGNQEGQDAVTTTDGTTANVGTTTGTTDGTATGTTGRTTTTTTAGANGTATTTDNIQDTTISRTEEVQIPERKVSEGHYVGWTPMPVKADLNYAANIDAKTDEIDVEKTGNETVAQGDEVTYVITVTNNTDKKLNKIEVKDRLDDTILDTNTVKFVTDAGEDENTVNWTENGTVNGNVIVWNVDIEPGKTVKITFKATVKTTVVAGTILKNSVIANGKEIDAPVETEIEEATKKITVIKEWSGEGNEAGSVRPSNVTINLENGAKAELTSANAVEGNTNQWSKEVEVDKYSKDGKELTYGYVNETSTDTNKFASYTNTGVDTTVADTVKVTNTYKAPEVTDETFTKDGTTTITSKDDELTYTISYSSTVTDYKGDATLTIVDKLPYEIDESKSDLNGGTYDANAKTITWTERITGIDTYANGAKNIEVSKTIKVVYVGMDVTSGTFKNTAQGTLKFDETGKEDPTAPVEEETTRDFKKDIKVIKVWSGDEEVAGSVRPNDVTINLTENKSIKLNANNANAQNPNIWEGTIEDVDKYNIDGSLKEYNYTGETSTDGNKLASYTATSSKQEDTITVRNTYKAPEVTDKTLTKTGTGKITSKDEKLNYTITYGAKIKDYKGDATLTVVDELPYAIDEAKSDLKGGKYDANAKTITWTEKITGIDTFASKEDYSINFSKNIEVVYVGMDTTSGTTLKNTVNATVTLDTINKDIPTGPVTHETEKDFKKQITVKKVWERDSETVRPSNVTITITDGKSVVLTPNGTNTWEAQIEVDKYDAQGNDKAYRYVSETSTETDKLANYTETIADDTSEADVIKVTNKYKTIDVSGTKTWDDVNNEKGKRPSSITLQLMQSVNGGQATEVANGEKTVNAPVANADGTIPNTWGYTFEKLPEFDENGNQITYSVVEKNVEDGYSANPDGMNVTNYYPVDKVTTTKSSEVVSCANGATEHAKTENGKGATAKYKTTVHEEDEIKYTITVANTGNKTTTVNINDPIKAGLTYDNGEITATLSGAQTDKNAPAVAGLIQNNVLSLQNYELDKGVTLTITFVVKVDTLGENETTKIIDKNIVTITNNGTTSTPSDETEYEVKKANITGSKKVSLEKAETGDTLTYTITATNNSDEEGKLTINDDLSKLISEGKIENVRNVKVNGVEKPECYANNKITYTDEHFAAHATVTLTFDATVKETALGSTFTNIAKINNRDYSATTKVVKKVYSTAKTDKPINLILVLDVSSSMTNNGSTRLADMKTAANSMIDQLFPDGKDTESTVSIIKFAKDASIVATAKGQDDKTTVKSLINGLSTAPGTNIGAALETTNSLLAGNTLNDNEKVVVFLSDGAPTPDYYISNGTIKGWGSGYDFSKNTESYITEQANTLKTQANVFSIGLGVNSLSTSQDSESMYTECLNNGEINVTTNKSYTIQRNGEEITGDTASSGDSVTYTITLTNNSNKAGTVNVTDSIKNQDITVNEISNGGKKSNNNISWSDITIPANGTVTLTYTATVNYGYNWRGSYSKDVQLTTTGTTVEQQMTGCGAENCIKADDGKYYHWEGARSVAKRILGKIASKPSQYKEAADGAGNLQSVFDQIFNEMHEESDIHYIEEPLPATVTVSETRKLVGDTVQVKIGDDDTNIQTYQISDLSTGEGVDGIKYTEGVGFTWTVKEANRNDRLELIYTCEETK